MVETAESVEEAVAKARANPPAYAVVDMRLGDGNGLDVVEAIREKRDDARAIILTGYGNIATAVTAVKLGAIDYLSKPADADDIFAALTRTSRRARGTARKPDVGRSRALGAHPARLRNVRPQCLGNRAPAQHASPHSAADPRQARAALTDTRTMLNDAGLQAGVRRDDMQDEKQRPVSVLREFLDGEAAGGIILMGAAALALIVANSPLAESLFRPSFTPMLGPLSVSHWINDGLMAVFFLLVGLEIKREMLDGQLSTWPRRVLPGIAAAGGMVVPALIYVAINRDKPRHSPAGRSRPPPTSPSRSACCRCSAIACRRR